MKKVSKKDDFVKLSVKNLVGIGLIGASSSVVNSLQDGTAKDIAKIIPAVQSTHLVSENLKFINKKRNFKM
jgi:hypothetical protein